MMGCCGATTYDGGFAAGLIRMRRHLLKDSLPQALSDLGERSSFAVVQLRRPLICARKTRFSATRYSFLRSSSSSTEPVTYASSFFQSIVSTIPTVRSGHDGPAAPSDSTDNAGRKFAAFNGFEYFGPTGTEGGKSLKTPDHPSRIMSGKGSLSVH